MKNIFKFLSIALIGGAVMFAACSKDDDDSKDNNGGGNNTPANNDKITSGTLDASNEVFLMDADTSIVLRFMGGFSKGKDVLQYKKGYYWKDADTTYWVVDAAWKPDGADRVKLPRVTAYFYCFPSPSDPERVSVGVLNVKYLENINDSTISQWEKVSTDWENSNLGFFDATNMRMNAAFQMNMANSADPSVTATMVLGVGGMYEFEPMPQSK